MQRDKEVFDKEVLPMLDEARAKASPIYVLHHVWNYAHLLSWLNTADRNIEHGEPGSKGPAIVTASGPSLDECIPHLNEARESIGAKIWCGNTQLWALYYGGVTADYVVKHDPFPIACPECGVLTYVDGDKSFCHNGHEQDMIAVNKRVQLNRNAPDIDVIPIAHPGVQKEYFNWAPFQKRGKLFIASTNPPVQTPEGYQGLRQHARKEVIDRGFDEYINSGAKTREDALGKMQELMNAMYNLPDIFAAQDMIEATAEIIYGKTNQAIRNPITHHVPYGPTTAIMTAVLAYYYGHDPIYFAGYDLGHWNGIARHKEYYHDGTFTEQVPSSETCEEGWYAEHPQVGEKYVLLSYLAKQIYGQYVMPGFRCVEIVAKGKPGNLELLPRIGIKELAAGGTRNIKQSITAAKIRDRVKGRGIVG